MSVHQSFDASSLTQSLAYLFAATARLEWFLVWILLLCTPMAHLQNARLSLPALLLFLLLRCVHSLALLGAERLVSEEESEPTTRKFRLISRNRGSMQGCALSLQDTHIIIITLVLVLMVYRKERHYTLNNSKYNIMFSLCAKSCGEVGRSSLLTAVLKVASPGRLGAQHQSPRTRIPSKYSPIPPA